MYCLAAVLFAFLQSFVLFVSPAEAEKGAPGVTCTLADDALKIASRIRGLSIVKKVPCRLQNKEQVEKYLREVITRDVPKERIDLEGRVYHVLGLIPGNYDYYHGMVALYKEQLAGYFEPEGHFYVMASWLPSSMQMSIAVHELTHALQDQHFDLSKFADETKLNNDELLARTALVEGDAMAVMMDFDRAQHDLPPIEKVADIESLLVSQVFGTGTSQGAPKSLEALLLFPYLSGLRFVYHLEKSGGRKSVDRAFLLPPQSTEQILHPEVFFARKQRSGFESLPEFVPELGEFHEQSALFSDTLGEFTTSVLLSQWIPPMMASSAGTGWGGDRLSYFESKSKKSFLLHWNTRWDTENDAKEFFDALRLACRVRIRAPEGEESEERKRLPFSLKATALGDIDLTLQKNFVVFKIYGQIPA